MQGYVSSISRATGNVTGLYLRRPELLEKQIGFLTSASPGAVRLAILGDVHSWNQYSSVEPIARSLHLNVQPVRLDQTPYNFDAAFQAISQQRAEMLLVLSSSLFGLQRSRIADLALRHRLPTMFTSKTHAHAGGLFSYGPDITAMFRRAADYVDRLAKGAKPTDLPIEQPTKFELAQHQDGQGIGARRAAVASRARRRGDRVNRPEDGGATMKLPRRQFLNLAAGAAALSAVSQIAGAQTYPSRPITMIVPFAAGGGTDVSARIISEHISRTLGQPIIIENIAGAGGTTGSTRAMRANADGYTIEMGQMGTHATAVRPRVNSGSISKYNSEAVRSAS